MSFTRFHDDECRIMKQLQESTDIGSYHLNVPGNGDKPYYFDFSHLCKSSYYWFVSKPITLIT